MSSFAIDEMFAQLVEKSGDKTLQSTWQEQETRHKKWQSDLKVPSTIEVGDKVDIRCLDYVWCVGTITLIVEQIDKEPLFNINKEGFSDEWDELMYRNSPRLAAYETYTSRNDLPKFVFNETTTEPDE